MVELPSHPLWHDRGPPLAVAAHDVGSDGPLPRADVLVVGLGATGLTAAVALASAGARVVAVDAVGVGGGAAGANGGFLLGGLATFHHAAVARHGRREAARWYHRSLDELARTVEEEPSARRTGSLRSAGDAAEAADLVAQHAALRRDGIAVEAVAGPLGPALLLPDDGVFDPMARCRRLAASAVAAGATLVTGGRVVVSGHEVRLAGRRVRPAATLVCVDGGLEEAVPALRGEVVSVRLQMLATARVPARLLDRPLYHRWGHDYAQQLGDGRLAVGGGRDLEDTAARGGAVRTTAVVQQHLDRLTAALGAGDAAVTHRWAAASAYTEDRLPLDRELAPGVHVLGGYSGHGNVVGVMLARAAAQRVLERLATARGGARRPRPA